MISAYSAPAKSKRCTGRKKRTATESPKDTSSRRGCETRIHKCAEWRRIKYLCNLKSDRDSWYELEKLSRRRKSSLYTIKRGEYINGAKTHPFVRGCSFCSRGRERSFRWHASDSYFIVPSGALSSSNVARPWGKSLEIAFRAKHVRRQLDWSRFRIRTFPFWSLCDNLSPGHPRARYFGSYF